MALPLEPPLEPQLAKTARELPEGPQWCYEPKYDGFRALAFVDGEGLTLQSRGAKPLHRYFPEVRFPPGRYVLDGELVIDGDLDSDEPQNFNALQQRLHPAASRI
jgi:ATP-dependent DNA ligase